MCARVHVYFKAKPSTEWRVGGGRVKGLQFSTSAACTTAQPSCHHHGCVRLCTRFSLWGREEETNGRQMCAMLLTRCWLGPDAAAMRLLQEAEGMLSSCAPSSTLATGAALRQTQPAHFCVPTKTINQRRGSRRREAWPRRWEAGAAAPGLCAPAAFSARKEQPSEWRDVNLTQDGSLRVYLECFRFICCFSFYSECFRIT